MSFTISFFFFFLISTVSGCAEKNCDEYNTRLEWRNWNPYNFGKHQLDLSLSKVQQDGTISKLLERIKSKRVQTSNLNFEPIRNNAELSRILLQQILNAEKYHDFPLRSNRADSKENYHLQASYIPRLG